jgi:cyclophilin family peptidyl-prolyl cis-trans isomerase
VQSYIENERRFQMRYVVFSLCFIYMLSAALAEEDKDIDQIDPMVYADSQVVLETSFGGIVLNLFPDVAPRHVLSITKLVNMGFYDSLTFHRAIPDGLIQGGSPTGMPTGKGPWTVPAEFSDLKHGDGTLAMARPGDINGGSCQFYICLRDMPYLNGKYTIFGEVADSASLAIAHKISRTETTGKQKPPKISDFPLETVYIFKAYMRMKPSLKKR